MNKLKIGNQTSRRLRILFGNGNNEEPEAVTYVDSKDVIELPDNIELIQIEEV